MTHHKFKLHHGDCREILRDFDDESIDSVVTDPPYELGFMGKAWDAAGVAYDVDLWAEVLRVLKPGGHLLAFGGTRTYHRMACAIEDAGFEIRDSIHWLYGSGFPKSRRVSNDIDRMLGHDRERVPHDGALASGMGDARYVGGHEHSPTAPLAGTRADDTALTLEAARWDGWGTALKPAHEPIVVARKPLAGTVAANVLAHGTGALNIDGCRVGTEDVLGRASGGFQRDGYVGGVSPKWDSRGTTVEGGRWPANVILDSEAATELDRQSGDSTSSKAEMPLPKGHAFAGSIYGHAGNADRSTVRGFNDSGGASRFFYRADHTDDDLTSFRYVPKPDRAERDAGLDDLDPQATGAKGNGLARTCATCGASVLDGCDCPDRTFVNPERRNNHPTVKPLDLMRWLVRLVTPPDGTVLDPFAGSGTTIAAALLEGFEVIGIELTDEYLPIIERRARWAQQEARFGAVTGPTVIRKTMPGEVSLFDDVEGTT